MFGGAGMAKQSGEAERFDYKALVDPIPDEPGIYMMKDHKGEIFYIGKAKRLKRRVRSYFSGSDTRPFVARLPRILADIDILLTRNEKEALLLERTMIQQHQPRHNVMLRAGSSYLQLRIDTQSPWPRVDVVRRRRKDRAVYFGPYHSASSLYATLGALNRHFKLRTCSDTVLANRSRPCLQYQIKRCPAPCVFDLDREAYVANVNEAILFLRGRSSELIRTLEKRMMEASDGLLFEQAAQLRDQISAVRDVIERQQVVLDEPIDQDVFALFREGERVSIQLLVVREGRMQGGDVFHFKNQAGDDEGVLSQFLSQYYDVESFIPDEVLLPFPVSGQEGVVCLLYTSPSPRDRTRSRMPSSA